MTLWIIDGQGPLSMKFPRQEYWSGLPFPPPDDLPDPGIKPVCPAFPALAGGCFTTEPVSSRPNSLTGHKSGFPTMSHCSFIIFTSLMLFNY